LPTKTLRSSGACGLYVVLPTKTLRSSGARDLSIVLPTKTLRSSGARGSYVVSHTKKNFGAQGNTMLFFTELVYVLLNKRDICL